MRKTTRKRYYGRSNVAQSLRLALADLNDAIDAAGKPVETPLSASLRQVLVQLNHAIEAERVYVLNRKRIRGKLERHKRELEALLDEVMAVPVLPHEKILKKRGGDKSGTL